MRVTVLAKLMAKFRVKFRTVGDEAREKQLIKYYDGLIKLRQIFPLFNENGILVALCEIWKIKEEDIPIIKEKKTPKTISEGNVIFVANVTLDPNFHNIGVFKFYRKLFKEHVYKGYKGFWYNEKRKRFSKIFGE